MKTSQHHTVWGWDWESKKNKEMLLLNQIGQMTDLWCRTGSLHATTLFASICKDEPTQHLMMSDDSCPVATHGK